MTATYKHRSTGPKLLLTALALVAASLAASAFVGTARADDPAPASGGAATASPIRRARSVPVDPSGSGTFGETPLVSHALPLRIPDEHVPPRAPSPWLYQDGEWWPKSEHA